MTGEKISNRTARLAEYKDFFATLASISTILALLIGGIWTYRIFIQQRTSEPRVKVSQQITDQPLTPDTTLLHVAVVVENIGHVKIDLGQASTFVSRVAPVDKKFVDEMRAGKDVYSPTDSTKVLWNKIAEKHYNFTDDSAHTATTVEPGETEVWELDLLIPATTTVVTVQSRLTVAHADTTKSTWWYAPTAFYSLQLRKAQ